LEAPDTQLVWLDPDLDTKQIGHATAKALYGVDPPSKFSPPFTHAPAHNMIIEASANRDLLSRILAGQRVVIDNTFFSENWLYCEYQYYVDFERRLLEIEGIEKDTLRIPFAALNAELVAEYRLDPAAARARFEAMSRTHAPKGRQEEDVAFLERFKMSHLGRIIVGLKALLRSG